MEEEEEGRGAGGGKVKGDGGAGGGGVRCADFAEGGGNMMNRAGPGTPRPPDTRTSMGLHWCDHAWMHVRARAVGLLLSCALPTEFKMEI